MKSKTSLAIIIVATLIIGGAIGWFTKPQKIEPQVFKIELPGQQVDQLWAALQFANSSLDSAKLKKEEIDNSRKVLQNLMSTLQTQIKPQLPKQ